jgi:hypothetical protein
MSDKCPEKLEPTPLHDINKNLTSNLVEATRRYKALHMEYKDLVADHIDAKHWKAKHDDLLADHLDGEEWKARHDDLLHQLQDEERGKVVQEWTDEMLIKADKDYEAVTKGVISLINLLRR